MANIIMKDVDAEKVSAKIIDDLCKRPCLCGCPYEDICEVKNIGACKVARALRERLAKGRDPRRRK